LLGYQLNNGLQSYDDLQMDNGSQSDNGSKIGGGSNLGAHIGAPLHGCPTANVIGQSTTDVIGQSTNKFIGHSITNFNVRPIIDENGYSMINENDQPTIDENGNRIDIEYVHPNDEKYGLHNKKYNVAIGDVVDWFKTMTTNEYIRGVKQYGWKRFDGKLWQRNYYEHIIRSTEEYERIAGYITDNPAKWQDDRFFK